MRVVVALGGNALLKRGEPMTAEVQRGNVRLWPWRNWRATMKSSSLMAMVPRWGSWPFRPRPSRR